MAGEDLAEKAWSGALEEAADELLDLFERAPCAYHCLDPAGVYVRINATEARWLGRSPEELVGHVKFTEVLFPESAAAYEQRMGEGRDRLPVSDLVLELRGPNGTRKRVLFSSNAVCDGRGALRVLRAVMVERVMTTSGVMARPEPRPDPSTKLRELVQAMCARAEGIEEAMLVLFQKLKYLEEELSLPRGLQSYLLSLREAAERSRALNGEIAALGGELGDDEPSSK